MRTINNGEHQTSEKTPRMQDEKVFLERLNFEQLLSGISARLIATPLDRVDAEIENALRQIMDFFQVDMCGILEISPNRQSIKTSHYAYAEGITHVPQNINLSEVFPWVYEKLVFNGQIISFDTLDDLPPEAQKDKQEYAARNVVSAMNIPIFIDGRAAYVIALNAVLTRKSWLDEYVPRFRLLGEVIVNTLELKHTRLQLDEQLRLETLLAEISGRFFNLPPDRVDCEIEDAQRRICECLDLDVSTLWQWSTDVPCISRLTHIHRPPIGPPTPETMYAHEYFPWSQEQLEAGRTVVISSLDDLPPEAERDKEVYRYFELKSALTVPLSPDGGHLLGTLSFNTRDKECTWPEHFVQGIKVVAQIFSNALVRMQKETKLREIDAYLRMTTDAVGAGLWIMDVETKKVWVSPVTRELFQFAQDEEITYESFFKVIHPGDRERVHQDVQHTLRFGGPLHCDYRIVHPDGNIRWIVARGQRYLKPSGEPERIMGLSLDITERKKIEIERSESQTLLASLINSTSDLIWSVDPKRFGLLTFNRGLYEYFLNGAGINIKTGMNPDELLPPEFARKWFDLYRRTLEEGTFTTEYQTSAGGRTLRLNLNTLQRDGEVFGISVFGQDITERKKMEIELSESQTLLTSLINSTSDMIWSVDAERFGILTYNCGLYDRFNNAYNIQLKGGETPDDLLPPEFARQWRSLYKRAIADGSFTTEYKAYAEGRTIRLNLNPLKNNDGVYGVSVFSEDITERKLMEAQLRERFQEIEKLKERLEKENVYLREETKHLLGQHDIVGDSKPIKDVIAHAEKVGPTDATVLVLGETGTGKELLARAIHDMSTRRDRTLVMVNCASLPPSLIESELFGREKGAYTGSLTKMAGRFELADNSTLFLDEIGDLPLELQSKLLRAIEQGEFERLGSTKTIKVNVRLIAATNHALEKEVREGHFRKDLYYRLKVFPITIPPLRDRKEDIPSLVWSFVKQFEKSMGKLIESVPRKDMEALMNYNWPGNIRELKNVIERAMILCTGKILNIEPPVYSPTEKTGSSSLEEIERNHIIEVLERTNWRLSGKNSASEILGMKRTTLQSKMKTLGIKRNVS